MGFRKEWWGFWGYKRSGYNHLMKILVIGGGGREHALLWKLKQSPKVKELFVAPGNAGTASIATNIPLSKLDEILGWVKNNPVDLVVVGPDDYLAEGAVDKIESLGVKAFGPTKEAAKLEWSKSFAKEFMERNNIPTARYKTFTNPIDAIEHIKTEKFPNVIKADGLALGKGVVIAESLEEAGKIIEGMMNENLHGDAGRTIVIEEYLVGREISTHVVCDGESFVMFPSSRDHKRAYDNDEGSNTGGMGTIAPLPEVDSLMMDRIKEEIVDPLIKGMKEGGHPFKGLLYPGIMITREGPKVIEFNARFGDPETQSYMRLLKSDLVDIMLGCSEGNLKDVKIEWSKESAVTIVLASGGYPGTYKKGIEIKGLETLEDDEVVFHAGTALLEEKVVTNGGRVLGVTAVAENLKEALNKAYKIADKIEFEGKQFRRDIGAKSL